MVKIKPFATHDSTDAGLLRTSINASSTKAIAEHVCGHLRATADVAIVDKL